MDAREGDRAAAQERSRTAHSEWSQQHPSEDRHHFVAGLPADPDGRGPWLVEELEPARGPAPVRMAPEPPKASRWRQRCVDLADLRECSRPGWIIEHEADHIEQISALLVGGREPVELLRAR